MQFTEILPTLLSVVSVLGSAVLVYKASKTNSRISSDGQRFTQSELTIDGLREDVAALDTERRLYYRRNVVLLQTIESYRAWGYNLVRLLTANGISDVPPEPEEHPSS